MGREKTEIEIRVHPKKGDNYVHSTTSGLSNTSVPYVSMQPYRKWTPWLVPLFIIVNIVVFVITMYVNNCPRNSTSCVARFLGRLSFQPLKENPLFGPSSLTLQKMGGLEIDKVVEGHQRWRLLTCIWLHGGVVHILANMLSLLFIGIRLEQEFGFVRIGMIYIISGIGGTIMSGLFLKSSISVGASGALFGLLGSMLSELITNWTMYGNKFAALLSLLFIIVINLAVGILPHVDNFAHIGGFLTGFLLGFVFLVRPQFGWVSRKYAPGGYDTARVKSKHKIYQYLLWIIALTLVIVGFTVGLVMIFRGINGNDHCSWCHYMSCVPTSKWSCRSKGGGTCTKTTYGNQMNMTCTSNGKTATYNSPYADSQLTQLCIQLCN